MRAIIPLDHAGDLEVFKTVGGHRPPLQSKCSSDQF
jgi:hypothetical protein